jgi:ERCC4-type nuclease
MEKTLPIVQIDTREQSPLRFENVPSERATLPVGDYGIRGFSDWENPAFIVERKNLEDLCRSLGTDRERFLREIEKMRGFRFRGLVIEAVEDQVHLHQYRSLISPSAILSTLDALSVRAGLHVFWCGDPAGAAAKVESLAMMFTRGIQKDYWRLAFIPALEGEKVA